jgi:hypothetical protein
VVTDAREGLSAPAELLKPLIPKHFRWLWESPSLFGWLTKWLEKRLQTISLSRPDECTLGSGIPMLGRGKQAT